ncbi:MAG: DUF6057 family protein [Planctomycetota bacterium]
MLHSYIFFVLFYLYFWLFVDPRFLYSGGGIVSNFPVFFRGWEFLRDFLSRPGGPLEYLAALLSQLFYIGWAGALVVTLQAWLLSVCVDRILKAVDLRGLRLLRFVPPIVLLITYTQYTFHFVTTTALLAALAFVCLYLKATSTALSGRFRVSVFLLLSLVLYYLGGAAYLLFAVLCAIYELLYKRRFLPGLLCLLSAAGIPYVVGVLVFGVSTVDAFSELLPLSWKILLYEGRRRLISAVYVLYLLLPVTLIASALWKNLLSNRIRIRPRSKHKKSEPITPSPILKPIIESLALFGIASAAVFFSYDAEKRTLSAIQYYACNRMWPEVLAAARRHPDNFFVVNAVNRALHNTGRLGYDMFCWPQHPDVVLQTGEDQVLAYWHKFDTQLDLGLMNMAEKNLTECMEVFGEHPMILQRLALINMVKANYGSARIYLGALSQTLFHSDWANDYLAKLQSDPNLSGDERIQHLRSVCMKKDYPTIFFSKERMLRDLLEHNGKNRMAFEYLMAWYMLNRQLGNIVRTIERMGDFEYREIPKLYEEALLIYVYGTKKTVNLTGFAATQEGRQRIEHFSSVFNRYGKNKKAAYGVLAQDYGDSYFFYHIYGISGVGK